MHDLLMERIQVHLIHLAFVLFYFFQSNQVFILRCLLRRHVSKQYHQVKDGPLAVHK